MRFLAVLALGLLAGCSMSPRLVSGTPENVSYKFHGNYMSDATQRATQYCAGFGRTARMQNVVNSGGDEIATFDCI